MDISRAQNMLDMTNPASLLHINEAPKVSDEDVVATKRVGVDYAGDWKNMPWRFYIKNNPYVSKP